MDDKCECLDCLENENFCYTDCDIEEMCLGCQDGYEEEKDRAFDEKCALGYK